MRNMKISFKLVALIVVIAYVGVLVFEIVMLGAILGVDGKSLWKIPSILAEAESRLDIPTGISY